MESDYLTMESEEVREMLAMIDRAEETLQLADKNYRPPVGAENNLTGCEVCELLHISPRTLQTLRDNGMLAYSQIGHKIFYKPEDVQRIVRLVEDKRKDAAYRGRSI